MRGGIVTALAYFPGMLGSVVRPFSMGTVISVSDAGTGTDTGPAVLRVQLLGGTAFNANTFAGSAA
jgi:hypothetical protein